MQPPAAINFVRPLISHVKIWERGLCLSPPSSTVSDIYISQVLEVDFYTPTSLLLFFCIQATGNIKEHFVSSIMEPHLIIFTDNIALSQMILCGENEETTEVRNH